MSAVESPLECISRFREYHDPSCKYYPPADVWGDGKLWIGSSMDASNCKWLNEKGITHVVNCAEPLGSYVSRIASTRVRDVIVLNAHDDLGYMILDHHLDDVLRFCDRAYTNDSNTRILIHCMAGVNRSATLALAYAASTSSVQSNQSRLERFADVFVHVMKQRPIILTNDDFYNQLLIWAQL
jgi:hypothetical protein